MNLSQLYRRTRLRLPMPYSVVWSIQQVRERSYTEDLPEVRQQLINMNPDGRVLTVRRTDEFSITSKNELSRSYVYAGVHDIMNIFHMTTRSTDLMVWTHVSLMFSKDRLRIWYTNENTGNDIVFLVYV